MRRLKEQQKGHEEVAAIRMITKTKPICAFGLKFSE